MDVRFTSITPLVARKGNGDRTNCEPCLYDMIRHYYTSHGIDSGKAEKLTVKYIEKFCEEERNEQI